MGNYHKAGFNVKLLGNEAKQDGHKIWYIPLFTVENTNKPVKVRIVRDAAVEVSLNSKLVSGPDFLVKLPAVLYEFRERLVGIGGYIEKIFQQGLAEKL